MLSLRAAQYDSTSIFNQRSGVSRLLGALFAAQSINLTNARLFVNPVPEERGARFVRAAVKRAAVHSNLLLAESMRRLTIAARGRLE
jgi:hypothetical protein